jgi:hypothetical protein
LGEIPLDHERIELMSEEQGNEREALIKATDDPEVEGHAVVKESDEPESDDEPDVEGHMIQKMVQKKWEK